MKEEVQVLLHYKYILYFLKPGNKKLQFLLLCACFNTCLFSIDLESENEHLTWSLPQVAEPLKKLQADSVKVRNEANQIRRYDPALDKQH